MKKIPALLFGCTLLAACNNGEEATVNKGEVDRDALESDGVTVSLDASLGSVDIPMVVFPTETDQELINDELESAVALVLVSDMTGSAADIAAGTVVDGDPSGPGEFSWEFNEDDDVATLTFWNETPGGLTLKTDRTYTAQFAVTTNKYIRTVPTVDVDVDVTQ